MNSIHPAGPHCFASFSLLPPRRLEFKLPSVVFESNTFDWILLSHVARQTESLVVLTVQPIGVRATFLHDTGLPLKGPELQLKPNPLLVQLVPQVVETALETLTTTGGLVFPSMESLASGSGILDLEC